mgnify:CR=1 FL=1
MIADPFFRHDAMTGAQTECTNVDAGQRIGREQHDLRARGEATQARTRLQHGLRTLQSACVDDDGFGLFHRAIMTSASA